jgi:hypothetical protein
MSERVSLIKEDYCQKADEYFKTRNDALYAVTCFVFPNQKDDNGLVFNDDEISFVWGSKFSILENESNALKSLSTNEETVSNWSLFSLALIKLMPQSTIKLIYNSNRWIHEVSYNFGDFDKAVDIGDFIRENAPIKSDSSKSTLITIQFKDIDRSLYGEIKETLNRFSECSTPNKTNIFSIDNKIVTSENFEMGELKVSSFAASLDVYCVPSEVKGFLYVHNGFNQYVCENKFDYVSLNQNFLYIFDFREKTKNSSERASFKKTNENFLKIMKLCYYIFDMFSPVIEGKTVLIDNKGRKVSTEFFPEKQKELIEKIKKEVSNNWRIWNEIRSKLVGLYSNITKIEFSSQNNANVIEYVQNFGDFCLQFATFLTVSNVSRFPSAFNYYLRTIFQSSVVFTLITALSKTELGFKSNGKWKNIFSLTPSVYKLLSFFRRGNETDVLSNEDRNNSFWKSLIDAKAPYSDIYKKFKNVYDPDNSLYTDADFLRKIQKEEAVFNKAIHSMHPPKIKEDERTLIIDGVDIKFFDLLDNINKIVSSEISIFAQQKFDFKD